MKNRYGDEYWFEEYDDNIYTIEGDLDHWRFGGFEGQDHLDADNLAFVDPSGGPFISIGYEIQGHKVKRIYAKDERIFFEVK